MFMEEIYFEVSKYGLKLANTEGLSLRIRSSLKQGVLGRYGGEDADSDDDLRPWRRRLKLMGNKLTWSSAFRIGLLLFLIAAILKEFLLWIKQDVGPWGPLVLAIAYVPLTVLAVPASILTLGGGYLFGLPLGFFADSIGATIGATAAFILGRTIGRSYVISKLKNYPKFQAVAIAIQRSGFKIVLLLRLVPLLPFNMLNYLLSVTPVNIGEYMLASWLGMMPITFALVYVGTTLKDLSDVTHGWTEVSTTRWVFIALGFGMSAILIVCITRIAKASLDKALAENTETEEHFCSVKASHFSRYIIGSPEDSDNQYRPIERK
ncbi:TVP38/TMEM64 family membrane protein [Quillaja saponaria]|uniref:TVP38/TMEM64 family membrane protein n=1 Tax=Quillaja saponaria TaxID=32244 RepID=A0AAD7Q9J2_QUISA|nr:TVP38/TMEM64 family membrane protein [Quillaja saponaria]